MADDTYTVERSATIAAPPERIYPGIFKSMDSLVGPDFEKGLARLKATAER